MIPSSIESTADLLLLKDLGGIVIDQLNSTQADSRVFECVCNFLKNWAVLHHHAIEQCMSSTEATGDMRNNFKSYLTQVILKAQTLLPTSWTEIKEQLHGQDAFETRSPLPKKMEHNRPFFLGPLLSLFRVLLASSPLFFAKMEVASENLLQQAIAFAAFTLGATESTQLPAAIDFLQQVVSHHDLSSFIARASEYQWYSYYGSALIYSFHFRQHRDCTASTRTSDYFFSKI